MRKTTLLVFMKIIHSDNFKSGLCTWVRGELLPLASVKKDFITYEMALMYIILDFYSS